ncbi:RNA polymerase sigma factor [Streptomyces sp. NPDC001927]
MDADLAQRLLDCYPTFMKAEVIILRKMTNYRLSRQACQDVAQEAYVKVAERVMAGRLGPGVQLAAYLRTASRNLAIDTLKAQARLTSVGDDAELDVLVPERRRAADDVDVLEELVVPAIDAMPLSRRRKVVQLQSQGLNDNQISKVLGIGPDRVHRDRYDAVIELRGELGKYIRDGHRKKKTTRRVKKDR